MTLRVKKNAIIVTSIVVLFVKLINKIFDKTIIVKTIINRSTTFSFFNIIRFLIIIQINIIRIKTLTIIKNINIAISIDNSISKVNRNDNLSRLHCNCLIRVNFYKSRSKTRQIRKIKLSINKSQTLKKIINRVIKKQKLM